jgi:hypothetical protein
MTSPGQVSNDLSRREQELRRRGWRASELRVRPPVRENRRERKSSSAAFLLHPGFSETGSNQRAASMAAHFFLSAVRTALDAASLDIFSGRA